jgi:hypothetical protein
MRGHKYSTAGRKGACDICESNGEITKYRGRNMCRDCMCPEPDDDYKRRELQYYTARHDPMWDESCTIMERNAYQRKRDMSTDKKLNKGVDCSG